MSALNPELAVQPTEAIVSALTAEEPNVVAAIRQQGAAAERERITAVRAQSLRGHEALIERLAMDGSTTGPEAAVQVLGAERSLGTKRAQAIVDDTPKPLPNAAIELGDDKPQAKQEPEAEARELSQAIAAKQDEARAQGRTLNPVEALALVKQERAK